MACPRVVRDRGVTPTTRAVVNRELRHRALSASQFARIASLADV